MEYFPEEHRSTLRREHHHDQHDLRRPLPRRLQHVSVRDKSDQYAEEMRRYNYVTPTSYLELITMIKVVLSKRQNLLTEKRSRLTVGLDKLNSTKQIVSSLKQQLAEQQPVLEATAIQVKEQQVQIAADQEEAKVVKAEAEASAAAANAKAAECSEIKDSAEAGLAEALPALDAAVKCLSKLDKSQIVEVKALKKPPGGVRLTLKAICIMFQVCQGCVATLLWVRAQLYHLCPLQCLTEVASIPKHCRSSLSRSRIQTTRRRRSTISGALLRSFLTT